MNIDMYCRWTLFWLTIKKFIRMLPAIVLETLLFGLILLGIGAYATKAIYGEKVINEIRVGVAANDGDRTADMLVRFAGAMDSVKDTVSFTLLSSEEEARKKLEAGELSGAILIPEGIVDSVLSGDNIPATILLDNSYSEMETAVFEEFTKAGARLLGAAQAGIYGADAFCVEKGRADLIQATEDYLNASYLSYALNRSSLLEETQVEAAGGLALADYYTVALLLAFLSFAGLSFGKYMQVGIGEREKLLGSRGIATGERYLMEAAAFSAVFSLLGTVICVPACLLLISKGDSFFRPDGAWLLLPALWFAVGTFIRVLLELTGNHAGGIGLSFMALMAFMTAAGVFIPTAFLPVWAEKIGRYLPYGIWMESMGDILQGIDPGKTAATLLFMTLFFLAAGSGAAAMRMRKVWK